MEIKELKEIAKAFEAELEKSNKREKTSLPYIVHEMPEFSLVEDGKTFQVIIIGGTFAVKAKVQKKGKTCKILSYEKVTLPKLANKEDFHIFMDHLIFRDTHVLSLNFAYPMAPIFENGKLDGELVRGTKGHTFRGLVGKKMGEEVEKYIYAKRKQKILVSCANDTVCLLLSGLEEKSWEKLGAGIVGSGMNFAFFLSKNKLVNLEAASFNKFVQTDTGREIDEESANPGKSTYEKEVAGVYLYKHFNMKLAELGIPFESIDSTEELDGIAQQKLDQVSTLALDLIHRSAMLVAAQIAGIMEFRKTDMLFVMEGSLFWKGYEYKKTVESTLKNLTQYKASFTEIKNSGVIGAAHLVM